MTRQIVRISLLGLVFLCLVECTAGPNYSSLQSEIQPVPPGDGRLFFYRRPRAGLQKLYNWTNPDILIDDRRVGSAEERVFFVDLQPGTHVVSCKGRCAASAKVPEIGLFETGERITIQLRAGESRYVSFEFLSDAFPPVQRMVLIDPAQGSQEILDLPYIHR
jgi:hypothetical protein